MIYVFENPNNNASVVYDENTLTAEQKTKGMAIESLPIPEAAEGKHAILKCKKSTDEVWWEYIDIAPDTEMEQLKQRTADLEMAIASILGGAV